MSTIAIRIARSDDHVVNVNLDRLGDAAKDFIFNYGLRQILNDAGASEKSADDKLIAAAAKLSRLEEGDLGRKSAESVDPVTREMIGLATEFYHAAIRKSGTTVKAYKAIDGKAEKLEAAIAARVAAGTDREMAEERVAQKRAMAGTAKIDLDDLGL